ncbi:MAG: NAD-binding protein [Nanoarchaeota archaeon]|nr:NAD-binding protein [Nanoarchaeota archaeon]
MKRGLMSSKVQMLLWVVGSTIVFGMVGYALLEHVSLGEGFVRTIETLTYVDEGRVGGSRVVQMLLHLFGVVIIWFALETSFNLMIQGEFTKHFSGVMIMNRISKLKDHYIVCGGGRVGERVAESLFKAKKKFVIIEKQIHMQDTVKHGYLLLNGDALDEKTLLDAGIKRAKAVISVLPETEKNILVTLSAKELNPTIKIYARADKKEYVKKLHKAGADFVSLPEVSCAEEIMSKIE